MAAAKRKYNGPCCGGDKMAGTGPGYVLIDAVQLAMAKRTKASWKADGKGVVATKCGNCKKIILPTATQQQRMQRFNLPSVYDERQLSEVEASTGLPPEDVIVLFKDAAAK